MKISNFVVGMAVGAVASALICKKVCSSRCKAANADENLAQANATIDSLRSSVDCFSKQLGERIESEQTYAARCEELNAKVSAQDAEIAKLKDLCAAQERKLQG
ncbi:MULTISPECIES: hypothetical protein [unclassified Fibrobacter]|uniref:hypothetical protein n=1 Tax=unclassified Fibrobacter TaxID=2634177 RepID=UPI000D6D3710|nr:MULTISPECIES: hypothetical protein [unclassified Fibrobacter]PWJ62283.1 hypothetical protein BGX12_1229 [Fibrobacter sp. UWR4]PZW67975.1 hypothetical protein C8E88_102210 [Fibrobacter sp. UWR1]